MGGVRDRALRGVRASARRPFDAIAAIPPLAVPARGVQAVYELAVTSTHVTVRTVNRVVGRTIDFALDVAEKSPNDSK